MKCLVLFLSSILLSVKNVTAAGLESASLIRGRETEPHEIKYLVSLQYNGEHFCGGSIIGDRHILTAAHCVIDDENEFENGTITVVAGTNDLNDDDLEPLKINVEKIYVHNHYNHFDWPTLIPRGDIAVLKLNQSLDLRRNNDLMKLKLPRADKRSKTYEGDKVVISGFGWDKVKVKKNKDNTEYNVGSSTGRMKKATAEVISNSECQKSFRQFISKRSLCARIIEHDDNMPQGVCNGDSGGPLVYNSNTIIGVVNSVRCNDKEQPGSYCRVSYYIAFIKNALKNRTKNMRVKEFKYIKTAAKSLAVSFILTNLLFHYYLVFIIILFLYARFRI